jgi:hypothetical protein
MGATHLASATTVLQIAMPTPPAFSAATSSGLRIMPGAHHHPPHPGCHALFGRGGAINRTTQLAPPTPTPTTPRAPEPTPIHHRENPFQTDAQKPTRIARPPRCHFRFDQFRTLPTDPRTPATARHALPAFSPVTRTAVNGRTDHAGHEQRRRWHLSRRGRAGPTGRRARPPSTSSFPEAVSA